MRFGFFSEFAPSQLFAFQVVQLHDDLVAEPDEVLELTLTNVTAGAAVGAPATLIISDNDRSPRIIPATATAGSFSLTLDVPPATFAVIEASEDLVNWTYIGNLYRSIDDPPVSFSEVINTNAPARFYRLNIP